MFSYVCNMLKLNIFNYFLDNVYMDYSSILKNLEKNGCYEISAEKIKQ